jgi:hypothetical protein
MKVSTLCILLAFGLPLFLFGCGGDDSETGSLSIRITDAKPLLEVDAIRALITFDEVRVHSAGGGWVSLPMPQRPYTIDLLQFINEDSTQLVPPVRLEPGKYTQLRLGVTGGSLVTDEGEEEPLVIPLEIPSENLKTNKNFDFYVDGGEAVDLMIDFDLSQSIKPKQDGYQLKPVLHLNETQRAAQIQGSIAASTFVDSEAEVTVTHDGEEYTKLLVTKTELTDPTEFGIFWLVPNNEYTVEVEVDGSTVHDEDVDAADLEPGEVFTLNLGSPI